MLERLLEPVHLVGPYSQLVCQFLLVFSRFEFALKQKGYARMQRDRLTVKWKEFAQDTQNRNSWVPSEAARKALQPLLERPPARQILENGRLVWEHATAPAQVHIPLEWFVEMIYRVRNNLFHGGKWPPEPARDAELLRASMVVINECLRLRPDLAEEYFRG